MRRGRSPVLPMHPHSYTSDALAETYYEVKVQHYDADTLAACGFRKMSIFAVTSVSSTALGGIQLCKKGVVGLSYEKSSPGSAMQGFSCVIWQYPVPQGHLVGTFGVLLQVAAGTEKVEVDATFSVTAQDEIYKTPDTFIHKNVFGRLAPLEFLALAPCTPTEGK
jgi:hypothetical protein